MQFNRYLEWYKFQNRIFKNANCDYIIYAIPIYQYIWFIFVENIKLYIIETIAYCL